MKKSTIGILLLVVGMLVGGVGVLQKITHSPNADAIRTTGTVIAVIGLLVYCYALFYKRK